MEGSKDRLRYIYEEGFVGLVQFTLDNFSRNELGEIRDNRSGESIDVKQIASEFICHIKEMSTPRISEPKVSVLNVSDIFELEDHGYKLWWFTPQQCRVNGYVDIYPMSGKYKDWRTGEKKFIPMAVVSFIRSILDPSDVKPRKRRNLPTKTT
jgi:hypothetical protein